MLSKSRCGPMQFWQAKYPKAKRTWVPGRSARIHAGFLDFWHRNGFGDRIVEKICSIVGEKRAASPQAITRVFITGASTKQSFICLHMPALSQLRA